jgi:adenylosuccinate synthase
VFEGAQGVLLDEWVGFHPFTTWSTCTFENASSLLREHGSPIDAYRLGVLRAHATRHGAGPFPTSCAELPPAVTEEHNASGPWQGHFRIGWLDAVLSRYAIAACGRVDGLALTHLDRFPPGIPWKVSLGYDTEPASDGLFDWGAKAGLALNLRQGAPRDLAHVERLGAALASVRPIYRVIGGHDVDTSREDIVHEVERALGAPVHLTSHGPTAEAKAFRSG